MAEKKFLTERSFAQRFALRLNVDILGLRLNIGGVRLSSTTEAQSDEVKVTIHNRIGGFDVSRAVINPLQNQTSVLGFVDALVRGPDGQKYTGVDIRHIANEPSKRATTYVIAPPSINAFGQPKQFIARLVPEGRGFEGEAIVLTNGYEPTRVRTGIGSDVFGRVTIGIVRAPE